MERMTEYEVVGGHVHVVPTMDVDQAMMRLAAYEDAGLTPSDVHSLRGEWDAMMSVLNSIGSYNRLRELAEADRDGRAVVLPCKAGDTVYQVGTDCLIHEDKINKVIYSTDGVDFDERAIGKSVFLTREEAEAVLRELSEIENGR